MTVDRHTRTRVCGPREEAEENSFYERKKGAEGHAPINYTALRQAERRFKKKEIDWTAVLDLQRDANTDQRVRLSRTVDLPGGRNVRLYKVVNGGGFSFIPGAVSVDEQKYWIKQAITSYMAPPNLCTLDAHYEIPQAGLYSAWKTNASIVIKRKEHPDDSEQTKAQPMEITLSQSEVAALIGRMRWTTLGYQYEWTSKTYDFGVDPIPFPSDLASWSRIMAEAAGFDLFNAEAGIVNFYQPGDTLTGHVDRSEKNMDIPLISLSLGASCIFLLGGASRDDPILPILLRSGDVVFMSGPSRSYYHGVPRILDPSEDLVCTANDDNDVKGALEILGSARININIRQVQ